ncbi:hypothetical protein B0T26DRAFT_499445 [Lasiosphaeria miniovina]|uniref:Uncharacterized protein n=1 Tax=Lasiosphaeria miniovina TaxID=1954250 RepID=A0AA39ZTN1_9PEZI|nr:uncharacterized protein B0T26DRAFT_499445 [Lasiosphaeria miniovina]KAK0703457.1 hypothetical protein B0T26DRAFT_499445 [Lasiosphaeria miniovina]
MDWTPFFPSPKVVPALPLLVPPSCSECHVVSQPYGKTRSASAEGGLVALCTSSVHGFLFKGLWNANGWMGRGVNVLLHNFPAAHTHHFILPGPLAGLQFDRGVEKGQDPWTASDFMCCGSYPHFFRSKNTLAAGKEKSCLASSAACCWLGCPKAGHRGRAGRAGRARLTGQGRVEYLLRQAGRTAGWDAMRPSLFGFMVLRVLSSSSPLKAACERASLFWNCLSSDRQSRNASFYANRDPFSGPFRVAAQNAPPSCTTLDAVESRAPPS